MSRPLNEAELALKKIEKLLGALIETTEGPMIDTSDVRGIHRAVVCQVEMIDLGLFDMNGTT